MCTFTLPFTGTNAAATQYAILNTAHLPITDPRYSDELKDLIDKLLEKSPALRPSI